MPTVHSAGADAWLLWRQPPLREPRLHYSNETASSSLRQRSIISKKKPHSIIPTAPPMKGTVAPAQLLPLLPLLLLLPPLLAALFAISPASVHGFAPPPPPATDLLPPHLPPLRNPGRSRRLFPPPAAGGVRGGIADRGLLLIRGAPARPGGRHPP